MFWFEGIKYFVSHFYVVTMAILLLTGVDTSNPSKSVVVVNLSVTATHNSAQMVTQYLLHISPADADHVAMPPWCQWSPDPLAMVINNVTSQHSGQWTFIMQHMKLYLT